MLAILVLCTAFSTGFVPQGEALPAPAAEASWPDSLRPTEYYTEGVKKLLIGEDTLAARALFLQALELTQFGPLSETLPGTKEKAG